MWTQRIIMKRRDFLKLIGIAPVAPIVLAAMPKKELTVAVAREHCKKTVLDFKTVPNYINSTVPIGFAIEDIPKDEYGWVHIYTQAQFICEQPNRSAKLYNVK